MVAPNPAFDIDSSNYPVWRAAAHREAFFSRASTRKDQKAAVLMESCVGEWFGYQVSKYSTTLLVESFVETYRLIRMNNLSERLEYNLTKGSIAARSRIVAGWFQSIPN